MSEWMNERTNEWTNNTYVDADIEYFLIFINFSSLLR